MNDGTWGLSCSIQEKRQWGKSACSLMLFVIYVKYFEIGTADQLQPSSCL
jgi:hypothetical protein